MSTTTITIIDGRGSRWGKSLRFVLVLGSMVGPGILFDSSAMQWLGAIMFVIWVVQTASGMSRTDMTIQEAQEHLRNMEMEDEK